MFGEIEIGSDEFALFLTNRYLFGRISYLIERISYLLGQIKNCLENWGLFWQIRICSDEWVIFGWITNCSDELDIYLDESWKCRCEKAISVYETMSGHKISQRKWGIKDNFVCPSRSAERDTHFKQRMLFLVTLK